MYRESKKKNNNSKIIKYTFKPYLLLKNKIL